MHVNELNGTHLRIGLLGHMSAHCDTLIPCALEIFLLTYLHMEPRKKHGHARRVRLEITDSGCGNKSVVLGPSLALTRYRYSQTASKPKTVHSSDVTQPRDGKSVYMDFATERIAWATIVGGQKTTGK